MIDDIDRTPRTGGAGRIENPSPTRVLDLHDPEIDDSQLKTRIVADLERARAAPAA